MSNSASRNGAATLFLTILTLVREPVQLALFDSGDAADIDADGGIELESPAAGGGFRVAEHHANLFANLVDEDERGARLGDGAGQLAEGLRHEPSLQADVGIAHFAIELCLGHQGGDRVDYQHIDSARADQGFSDFERLLAEVGLRDEQVVGVHAEFLRVDGVEGCSASTKAARPPAFWASAMIWRVMVVLPEDSGPKISMTRPRGTPPTPRAASKLMEPVEITEMGTMASLAPRRMMEPLPNCFSIWLSALSTALARSSA